MYSAIYPNNIQWQNKKGLIIYFGQKFCPYCKAHINNNWGQKDIIKYTQDNFDVIAINVKGQRPVINTDGKPVKVPIGEGIYKAKHIYHTIPAVSKSTYRLGEMRNTGIAHE